MKKKRILFVILLSSFFIISSFSQKNVYSSFLIPEKIKQNANAVVRESLIEVTLEAVDKIVVYEKKIVTVFNKQGDVDANIYKDYDDDTKITKLSAIIYDAFGNQIKKYTKGKFLDASAVDGGTLYSDARVKYVNYTPIGYPYTLVFESEYKSSSTGFIPRWFPTNGYFVGVEKSEYKLLNPLGLKIRTKQRNFTAFGVKNLSKNNNLHFVLENQPGIKHERHTVSAIDFMPYLVVASNTFALKGVRGTASNWKEFGKWENDNLLKGRGVLDEKTVLKIKELVKNVEDPIEKAKIVYQYVQNKTHYIGVQVGIGGWEPIAANEVDKVGYGDCKGLTNYTKALLDVVGVTSYYTLVYAKRKRNIDKEFTSLEGNHAFLNIPNNGHDIWLECTSQTTPFGFLGGFTDDRDVLVITPEGGIIKRTPAYKSEDNLQETQGEIRLEKNGNVTAHLKRVSKGIQYGNKYGYADLSKKELIKRYKSDVWDYNNNLEIVSVNLENDKEKIIFKEDLKIFIENYAVINKEEYLFRANIFNKEGFVPKRYRNRKLPLQISRGYKNIDSYQIKIPEGYSIETLPSEKVLTSKFGFYKVVFTKIDDTTFKYHKTIIINEGTFPKEDYKLYRSFRKSIARYENLRIAIVKKN